MNIAVFGGSFDPPHLGHEAIVHTVLDTLDIDKLIIIPAYLNPFKDSSVFTADNRLELMQDLFDNNDKVEVNDYEVKQEKSVPTIETIEYLKSQGYDNIKLIIGADNLKKLHMWKYYDKLKQLVSFIVITRDGIKVEDFDTIKVDYEISSTRIRENLDITLIPKKIQEKVKKLWKKE